MVKLVEINTDNVWKICNLKVKPDQENFVATNVQSLVEAFATRNENGIAFPFGIYDDQTPIGFCMIGYDASGEDGEPKIAVHNYCLWRFMLSVEFQGKGYAAPALDEILKFVRTAPCGKAEYCWLSYEPENEHGKAVYEKYGFRENGEMCGEEVVSVIKL